MRFLVALAQAKGRRKGQSMKRKWKRIPDMQKLFRLVREESGSELVEFSVVLWLLILLLFGVFQWAYAMYAYHFTTYAAQEGTRFAMVRGATWSQYTTTNCSTSAPPGFTMKYACTASSTDIQNYVQSLAPGAINRNSVTIDTTTSDIWPGENPDNTTSGCATANSKGCLVKVKVSYTFNFLPFLKISAVPMSATSEKVILE
jgi:Flp pilus assembly protein TadG